MKIQNFHTFFNISIFPQDEQYVKLHPPNRIKILYIWLGRGLLGGVQEPLHAILG